MISGSSAAKIRGPNCVSYCCYFLSKWIFLFIGLRILLEHSINRFNTTTGYHVEHSDLFYSGQFHILEMMLSTHLTLYSLIITVVEASNWKSLNFSFEYLIWFFYFPCWKLNLKCDMKFCKISENIFVAVNCGRVIFEIYFMIHFYST